MQQGSANRTSRDSLSSSLAAGMAGVRFPGEDDGRSLGEMAQRDLDAALQLLADRAQYITGSSGAAIALRRSGMNDMMCRASSGSNAPELGALLSTEFGLSGESVRTRQLLRCDNAERDARVNREVCRELGIASVAVMPVVNDDEVLGVFELFSGKPHAFGDRDFAALKRLSEMVETAVKLARAAESIPEKLKAKGAAAQAAASPPQRPPEVTPRVPSWPTTAGAQAPKETDVPTGVSEVQTAAPVVQEAESAVPTIPANPNVASSSPQDALPSKPASGRAVLWSVALDGSAEGLPSEADQSHLPAAFRNLRKCEVCGFPISAGRLLCVECEEKKWRGQLRGAPKSERPDTSGAPDSPFDSAQGRRLSLHAPAQKSPLDSVVGKPGPGSTRHGIGNLSASSAAAAAALAPQKVKAAELASNLRVKDSAVLNQVVTANEEVANPVPGQTTTQIVDEIKALLPKLPSEGEPAFQQVPTAEPELVLSAGLEPQQSWFGRNKFVVIAMAMIAAGVVAFLLLH